LAWVIPYNLLGLTVSGDIGGTSIYTNKNGKIVWYPKAPPDKPPTRKQIHQRQRFSNAVNQWKMLTPAEKQALEDATKKVSAMATGQNVYVSDALRPNHQTIPTLARQSGLELPTPTPIDQLAQRYYTLELNPKLRDVGYLMTAVVTVHIKRTPHWVITWQPGPGLAPQGPTYVISRDSGDGPYGLDLLVTKPHQLVTITAYLQYEDNITLVQTQQGVAGMPNDA